MDSSDQIGCNTQEVMKTLQRFIDEDDMDFDEASESAVEKRKFLLNRVMKKKPLLDDDEDEEDAERMIP